jgi:hypothetical protein
MSISKPEPIIEIGAEGGSITLFGFKTANGAWHFSRTTRDETPTYLDPEEGGPAINHTSAWVKTWPEALTLLDRYPWAMLSPLQIHPDFRHRVWDAVQKRLEHESGTHAKERSARWARMCRAETAANT